MSEPASQNDEQIGRTVARYERPLTLYALRLLGGDLDRARDVVQETFARLIAEGGRASENGHLPAWLYTVCRNKALDVRRKERRMTLIDDSAPGAQPTTGPDPAIVVADRDEHGRVLRLLDRLPANQQEVLRLKFQHGLSYREISAVTNLSESNVGFLIHTGLKTLRDRLGT